MSLACAQKIIVHERYSVGADWLNECVMKLEEAVWHVKDRLKTYVVIRGEY